MDWLSDHIGFRHALLFHNCLFFFPKNILVISPDSNWATVRSAHGMSRRVTVHSAIINRFRYTLFCFSGDVNSIILCSHYFFLPTKKTFTNHLFSVALVRQKLWPFSQREVPLLHEWLCPARQGKVSQGCVKNWGTRVLSKKDFALLYEALARNLKCDLTYFPLHSWLLVYGDCGRRGFPLCILYLWLS